MTIIKLKGGLGNQMFQYAYGRNLELSGEKVVFDISFFTENRYRIDTARDFKLDKLNIETKAEFSKEKHLISDFLNKIMIYLGLKENGFWQSEKYFKDIKDIVRKEFTLKNPRSQASYSWQKKIEDTENPVSLHIRRGDYIEDPKTNAYHGVCDISYYKKALEIIEERLGKNIEVFVFSDDIAWAKENLTFIEKINFVSNNSIPDHEEMYLMSLCRHNIIANSSFSWWGAWLNQNQDKMVIAPKKWNNRYREEHEDLLPSDWMKI